MNEISSPAQQCGTAQIGISFKAMKSLLTIVLALSFLTTVVSVSLAQDTSKKSTKQKKGKGGKKKSDETKKDSSK